MQVAGEDQQLPWEYQTLITEEAGDRAVDSAARRGWLAALATLGALAHLVPEAQREHSQHGGAPSELVAVLAVKRFGVASRCRRRVVCLASAGVAVTLTLPAHDRVFGPEAIAMAEYPTAQHQMIVACARRRGCDERAEAASGSFEGRVIG